MLWKLEDLNLTERAISCAPSEFKKTLQSER